MGGMTLQSESNSSTTRVIYEDGGGDTTTVIPKEGGKLSVGTHLSGPTPYHLLEGNLSVTNTVPTNGFSITTYTGNDTNNTIDSGVDNITQWGNDSSEKFGGLIIGKARNGISKIYPTFMDTLRGTTKQLFSNSTNAEATVPALTFNNNGVTLPSNFEINGVNNYVIYNFGTTHRRTSISNHGQSVEEHYNPITGFGMIKYNGSGASGHEIFHSLGRKLAYTIIKNSSIIGDWRVDSELVGVRLSLNLTNSYIGGNLVSSNDKTFTLPTIDSTYNANGNTYIMYYFGNSFLDSNKKLIGNFEIGSYKGTGGPGNKVYTKGKPCFALVKRIDVDAGDWVIVDNVRGNNHIYLNNDANEYVNTDITLFKNGLSFNSYDIASKSLSYNEINGQYMYLIVYDNDNNSGRSKYPKVSDTSTLYINNALIPFASGVSENGTVISNLLKNEAITGLPFTQGKNYVYCKKDGTYGVTNLSYNIDTYNGFGDYFDTVKNKWFRNISVLADECKSTYEWVGGNGNITMSPNNNMIRVTCTSTSFVPTGVKELNNLVIGKTYYVKAMMHETNSIKGRIIVGTGIAGANVLDNLEGVMSGTFVATANTLYLGLQVSTISIGAYGEFNNVVCYPLNLDGTIDTYLGTEIIESRNYLDAIVYADHNGQITHIEEVTKNNYENDLVVSNTLTYRNVLAVESDRDYVYNINGKEKLRVKEDGSILNQDGMVLSSGGFKNMLINGDFSIDQYMRGGLSNFVNSKPYTDRWWVANSSNCNVGQLVSTPNGFVNSLYVSKNAGQDTQIVQRLEFIKDNARKTFNGKKYTLSFWIKSDVTNFIEYLFINKNGVSANSYEVRLMTKKNNTIAGKWVRMWGTIEMNWNYEAGDFLEIRIDPDSDLAGILYLTGVQLEEGSVPTPFEFRNRGLEFSLCQRYYQAYLSSNTSQSERTFHTRHTSSVNQFILFDNIQFPPMRTLPTISLSCLNGSTTRVSGVSNNMVIENDWSVYVATPMSFTIYKIVTPVINTILAFDAILDAEL